MKFLAAFVTLLSVTRAGTSVSCEDDESTSTRKFQHPSSVISSYFAACSVTDTIKTSSVIACGSSVAGSVLSSCSAAPSHDGYGSQRGSSCFCEAHSSVNAICLASLSCGPEAQSIYNSIRNCGGATSTDAGEIPTATSTPSMSTITSYPDTSSPSMSVTETPYPSISTEPITSHTDTTSAPPQVTGGAVAGASNYLMVWLVSALGVGFFLA